MIVNLLVCVTEKSDRKRKERKRKVNYCTYYLKFFVSFLYQDTSDKHFVGHWPALLHLRYFLIKPNPERSLYIFFFLLILFFLRFRRSRSWVGWVTWRTCPPRDTTATLASPKSTRAPARFRDWSSPASYWRNTSHRRTGTLVSYRF